VEPWAVDTAELYTPITAAVVESTQGSHYFVQRQVESVIWSSFVFNNKLVFEDTVRFKWALEASQCPYGNVDGNRGVVE
jgi:hypothetical protein